MPAAAPDATPAPAAPRRTRARLGLLWFLARASLRASPATFALIVASVLAAAGFQIANTANLAGFEAALLEENLTRGAGDVRLEPRGALRFEDGDAIAARLRAHPAVRDAQPVLVYPGAVGKAARFFGAPIFGIGPSPLPPFQVVAGTATLDADHVLVGTHYANRLGLAVGDRVELRAIYGAAGAAIDDDSVGRYAPIVSGVVGGTAAYRAVFVARAFLAREAGVGRAATQVHVHLFDHERARAVAAELAALVPGADAIGWRDDASYVASYLTATRTIGGVSYAMVVAAVAVPMWALMYIHVLKRRRELALLLAVGFGELDVLAAALLQAIGVAALGCALGAGLGLGLIAYFTRHPIYRWETLIVRPAVAEAVFIGPAAVLLVTAVLASGLPAWRAAKTDPARVLRGLD